MLAVNLLFGHPMCWPILSSIYIPHDAVSDDYVCALWMIGSSYVHEHKMAEIKINGRRPTYVLVGISVQTLNVFLKGYDVCCVNQLGGGY
jgi:hypothetical protein